jgi:2-polyprenyl-3-methyl-5-hydroxy-6-metoxy-1,4-benzoquinol methylase
MEEFDDETTAAIADFVKHGTWYHSISFPRGMKSSGVYDHEKCLPLYGFPHSLEAMEVLDVGCSDGFFAFEFERRGAKEVWAVDTDQFDGTVAISPAPSKLDVYQKKYQRRSEEGRRFLPLANALGFDRVHYLLLAKVILRSHIRHDNVSIYDLRKLNRRFDLVFCGDLIEHLKNPIEAVECLRDVCRGQCIISLSSVVTAPFFLAPVKRLFSFGGRLVTYWGDSGGSFFHFTVEAFEKLLVACGFREVRLHSQFKLRNRKTGEDNPHAIFHGRA